MSLARNQYAEVIHYFRVPRNEYEREAINRQY